MSEESIKSELRKRYDAGSVRGEDRFFKDIIEKLRWIPVSEGLPERDKKVLVFTLGKVCIAKLTKGGGLI